MALTAYERETIVRTSDDGDRVVLYSAQRTVIRKVENDDRWTIESRGEYEGSLYINASCDASAWSPLGGMKSRRKPMSEEQRAASAARLAAARESRKETTK